MLTKNSLKTNDWTVGPDLGPGAVKYGPNRTSDDIPSNVNCIKMSFKQEAGTDTVYMFRVWMNNFKKTVGPMFPWHRVLVDRCGPKLSFDVANTEYLNLPNNSRMFIDKHVFPVSVYRRIS
jgi:hypothetical protein